MHISAIHDLCYLLALYFYEYVVTLDQEINHVWARKWTISTWIFVVNRYTALVAMFENFFPVSTHAVGVIFCR